MPSTYGTDKDQCLNGSGFSKILNGFLLSVLYGYFGQNCIMPIKIFIKRQKSFQNTSFKDVKRVAWMIMALYSVLIVGNHPWID